MLLNECVEVTAALYRDKHRKMMPMTQNLV